MRWSLRWACGSVGCHPSRAGITAHRLGWPPRDGVSGTGDPALATRSWVLLGGCSWLQDCPQTPLGHEASKAPWLPACPVASPPAPRGWKRLAGMAGDVLLPPRTGGKGAPLQHWQKALGLFGAWAGHESVGGAPPGPWAGGMTYGKKYLAEMKFLVEHREVLAELDQGLGRGGGQRPCIGKGKTLSRDLGLLIWWCVPSGCHLSGCVLAATLPRSCAAPGALLQGLRWLLGCSGWRSAPQNYPFLSTVWKQHRTPVP